MGEYISIGFQIVVLIAIWVIVIIANRDLKKINKDLKEADEQLKKISRWF